LPGSLATVTSPPEAQLGAGLPFHDPYLIEQQRALASAPSNLSPPVFLNFSKGRDSAVPNSARIHFLFMTDKVGQDAEIRCGKSAPSDPQP